MSRNILFAIIGALVIATAVLGYQLQQEKEKPGLHIDVGKDGLSVQTK